MPLEIPAPASSAVTAIKATCLAGLLDGGTGVLTTLRASRTLIASGNSAIPDLPGSSV
ncbi:MAG: hypothetical protein ABJ350_07855 [Anderseniella sp.]